MDRRAEQLLFAPNEAEVRRLHRCWPWLVALGVGVIITGLVAVAYSVAATLTTVLVFGVVLIVGGAIQVVSAFLVRSWRGFFVTALVGVLHVLVGVLMVEHPLRAAAILTLVLAVAFLAGGTARLLYAATHAFPGRGWMVFNGVVTLILGLSIWREWPEASLWVIGLFVGIDLAFSGWSWVMLGLALKAAGGPTPAAPRTTATSPA
ncbi:MAG: HdeD family acid-resistance protein [Gemmataceae bacterium]|nr:HdeD family acid-resistance protein [Gemmataceae bacterium]